MSIPGTCQKRRSTWYVNLISNLFCNKYVPSRDSHYNSGTQSKSCRNLNYIQLLAAIIDKYHKYDGRGAYHNYSPLPHKFILEIHPHHDSTIEWSFYSKLS